MHPRLGGLILAVSDEPQSTKAWATRAQSEAAFPPVLNFPVDFFYRSVEAIPPADAFHFRPAAFDALQMRGQNRQQPGIRCPTGLTEVLAEVRLAG